VGVSGLDNDLESSAPATGLTTYLRHYNTARPHRGIDFEVLIPGRALKSCTDPDARSERVDVLGGLIHEYRRAA
jgi:putative transposase